MVTKTISVKEEAYRRLKSFKKEGESFSDVIMNLTDRDDNYREGFGSWKGDSEKLRKASRETREELDKDLRDRE